MLFLMNSSLFSQDEILDKYPRNQEFYEGGISQLYSDIHQIIVDKKMVTCENPKELYRARLLLTKEGEIKFVKDADTEIVAENKCAHDLSLKLAGYLKTKTWNAAIVKGAKFSSIIELLIFPDDLFEKYRSGYNPYRFYKAATFKDGEEKMNAKFRDNFKSLFSEYHINGRFYLDFYIDKDGEIVSPGLEPDIMNDVFKREFFRTLRRLNQKWNPATFHDIPLKSKISMPMGFSVEYYQR